MPRTTGSHGEITARRIKQAALKLFANHGYAVVSMRQIADAVGIQAGGIYNYCATKQDLLLQLLLEHHQQLLSAWQQSCHPQEGSLKKSQDGGREQTCDDPQVALEAFVLFHIRYHADKADQVFISYMELRNLEPQNFAAIEKLRRRYEQHLRAILKAGQNKGVFIIKDVPVCAMALIAMLNGLHTWYRDGGRLPRRKIEKIYLDMALSCAGFRHEEATCLQPV